jgi:uncharacterized protein
MGTLRARALPAGCALALLLLACALAVLAQIPVPPLEARVTDLTSTLTPAQRQALESKLEAFERRKGSQLAVLIVPSTAPEDIAEFGIRVAEAWKLGRRGIDDGAILIVAKNDRRMRIEVGYGLEGVLTDAICRRIIEETIAPRFRTGDYYGGIDAGLDRMMGLIEGEPLPEPDPRWSPRSASEHAPGLEVFLPLLVPLLIAFMIVRAIFGRTVASLGAGAVVGLVAWTLTHVFLIALMAAAAGFLFALFFGSFLHPLYWTSGRRGGHGGWMTGGWGGGGFGGGGFRGGGGGFGGGGASGGW